MPATQNMTQVDHEKYQVRQAHWHPEDVHHLMPSGPDVGFLLNRWDERARDSIALAPAGAVLDVGCGNGRDLVDLARRGWRGCGVEPSSRQLLEARELIREAGGEVALVRAVAERLPFKAGVFDAVLCKSAIDHVTDRDAALRDFARVLRPDGRAVVSAVNFGGLTARLSRASYKVARRVGLMKQDSRRFWDPHVPDEHTFEGTYANLVGLGARWMSLSEAYGVSLFFGLPRWGWLLAKLPERWANRVLRTVDGVADGHPALADVVVCVLKRRDGTPEPSTPAAS